MSGMDTIGEYSPMMLWDVMKETRDGLSEHCRVHKTDIDNLYSRIDKNAREQKNDSTEIKQSIAELSQSVSLLAQKIECAPATYTIPKTPSPISGKYAWVTGAVIAALFGISQFWEYLKK